MTPSDLARWDMAFLEKRILNENSYRAFTTEVKLKNGNVTHYALGLEVSELDRVPMIEHGGEVSGFLTENMVFPTKRAAVVVCSNQDGTEVIVSVSHDIADLLVGPEQKPAPAEEIKRVTGILNDLSRGRLDRALFTANANSYFSSLVLQDYSKSLKNLGKLHSVSRVRESARGGMIHRTYKAAFQKKSVNLNIYVMPDGKYEQFLVEESF